MKCGSYASAEAYLSVLKTTAERKGFPIRRTCFVYIEMLCGLAQEARVDR